MCIIVDSRSLVLGWTCVPFTTLNIVLVVAAQSEQLVMGWVTTSCDLDRVMSLKHMATKRGLTQLHLVQMACKGEMTPANMGQRNLNYMDNEHIDLVLASVSITGGLLFVLLCAFQGHSDGYRWAMKQINSASSHTTIIPPSLNQPMLIRRSQLEMTELTGDLPTVHFKCPHLIFFLLLFF